MARRAPDEVSNEVLVRYLQGEMTRSEIEETERLVADSRRTQARLDELRAMTGALAEPPDWVRSTDLTAAVGERIRAAAPGPARPAPRRAVWFSAGAAAAAAVAVAIVLLVQPSRPVDEPRAKGGGAAGAVDPDRWVGIALATADGAPVAQRLPKGELMVKYTNLGPEPYSHLMVFALTGDGEVRWFYPAYQEAGTDPAAIAIEPGVADRVLPDLVEHEFARGGVVVCGLFLRRALTVREVEAALAGQALTRKSRLPFPGAGQHCVARLVE